jgi:phenylacetate-CoA ligase
MFDSILHLYRNVYYRMPQLLKSSLGESYGRIPLNLRFGKLYSKHLDQASLFANGDTQWQMQFLLDRLQNVASFAEANIPFYRHLFSQYGFHSDKIRNLSNMDRIPFLTKQDIKANLNALYTSRFEKATPYYTGGSTSIPVKYILPLYTSRSKARAYLDYIYGQIGYRYRDRTVLLKGRDVSCVQKGIFWEYDAVQRFLVVSSNHLTLQHSAPIMSRVREFAPSFFYGYPSGVLSFINMAERAGVQQWPGVKGVILASENVYDEIIVKIRAFFDCPVLSHFGHTERAVIGYKIDAAPYRFLGSYGIARIVDGEIVATSFDNCVMPFINYRTNDYVEGHVDYYPGTDIAINAERIIGRLQEFLVTKDHRLISICNMGAGHFSALEGVDAIQYRQKTPGKVDLLVQSNSTREVDSQLLKKQLETMSGNSIAFDIIFCENIPKSSRGKRIMCIQELEVEKYR